MAGLNAGFSASDFRQAITFVYEMAKPNDVAEQVYFFKEARLVYNRGVDTDDLPFDPLSTVTRVQDPPVQVPCGIEYQDSNGLAIDFGTVEVARLVLTLLDTDYAKVKGAIYVTLRGEKYNYKRTVPPDSLFDVSLYDMHFEVQSMS